MVVSIKKVTLGGERYYADLAREDYYTKEGELPGQWLGQGAIALGLDGVIHHHDPRLTALFEGRHPYDGSELRRGATTVRHYERPDGSVKVHSPVGAYDFTVSLDKSVSVLWAVSPVEARESIQAAHSEALHAMARFMETQCYTRTGEAGRNHESVKGVFARFDHSVSRSLDPQIHSHLLLLNVGIRADGRAGALDGERLLHLQFECSKVYDAEMRQQLYDRLGLVTAEKPLSKGMSFEIVGVPQDLCRTFSKRRQEIEKVLSPHDTAKQVQVKVLATRSPKVKNFDREALFTQWHKVGCEFGFDAQRFLEESRERAKSKIYDPIEERKSESRPPHVLSKYQREQLLQYHRKARRYWKKVERKFDRALQRRQKHRARMKRKILVLYATGKISRADYLRYTEGRGLPTSQLGINLAYATRRISRKQQRFLLQKHGHERVKEPRTRVGIEIAYMSDRISALQRLTLLKKHGHFKKAAPAPPVFQQEPLIKQRSTDEHERER
ncbi:MobF family relaxase [Leptolyngbya sp. GGD]|uniref:MobF family relaxase n=1 Tax=Leptolyngbya sp. GGD TaxID=2997907 RepID=UPI00227D2E2E|nr:MobF family relaxase [Leptolyngbya sp. GGD]MCY6494544.1 relaxase domain-containing protein [Leptolyngbya sp. GGD]